MVQFLQDIFNYCQKYNINFGELSRQQQNKVIYRTLKYVLKHNISKKYRIYLKNLDTNSANYI